MTSGLSAEAAAWSSAWALGRLLAESPAVARIADVLKRSRDPSPDAPLFLTELAQARRRVTIYDAQPLLLGAHLPNDPSWPVILSDPASKQFRADIDLATAVMFSAVEWQRAALPGYPTLLVAHLDSHAPRVADDGFPDLRAPWPMEARRLGLQLEPDPPGLFPMTGIDAAAATEVQKTLRRALTATRAWQNFRAAHEALDSADIEQLRQERRGFREQASDEAVERVVGGNLLQRRAYLHAVLHELEHAATGCTADYYRAFTDVDRFVDDVQALMTWAATGRDVLEAPGATIDWWPRPDGRRVRMRGDADAIVPSLRAPVAVRGPRPALSGIALVSDANLEWTAWPLTRWDFRGRLLEDSAELLA